MKTFTTYAEKKAKQIFNLLQGYTKGIRMTAILILLLMGVSNAWAYDIGGNGVVFYYANTGSWTGINMYYWGSGWSNNQAFTKINNTNIYYYKFSSTWTNLSGIKFNQAKDDWSKQSSNDITGDLKSSRYWKGTETSSSTTLAQLNGAAKVITKISTGGNYTEQANAACVVTISGYNLAANATSATAVSAKTGSASSASINAAYGSTIKYASNTPTGYDFKGFSTSNSTSLPASLSTTKSVTASKVGGTANTTYYAYYLATQYTITYELNGGSGTMTPTTYNIETATFSLPTPTRSGYTFKGWYENASFTGTAVTQIAKGTTGNKTFYAKWEENDETKYNVTAVADPTTGGTVTPATATLMGVNSGGSITATPNEGYEFTKWSLKSGYGYFGATGTNSSSTTANTIFRPTQACTIKATFTEIQRTIKVTSTNASYGTVSPTTVKAGVVTPSANITATPEEGYEFNGWSVTQGGSKITLSSPSSLTTQVTKALADGTITADFKEKKHTVTISYKSGNTNLQSAATQSVGEITKTSFTAPAITGYTFTGWTLGTGITNKSANTTVNPISITTKSSGTYSLTANYEKTKYALTFGVQGMGGTVSATVDGNKITSPHTAEHGTVVTLTASAKDGYKFNKWVDGSGTQLSTDATYSHTLNAAATIKAVFTDLNVLYLKPNSSWSQKDAWFAAYFFNNSGGNYWVKMTCDDPCEKNKDYYRVKIPQGTWTHVIFVRMGDEKSDLNWDSKWNQTGNLEIPTNGNNLFTVPVFEDGKSWDGATTTWSTYTSTYEPVTYNVTVPAGTPNCYICGGWNWNEFIEMTKVDDTHYTITLDIACEDDEYKYCYGPSWDCQELQANCTAALSSNRTYSAQDEVACWKQYCLVGDVAGHSNDNWPWTETTKFNFSEGLELSLSQKTYEFKVRSSTGKYLTSSSQENNTFTRSHAQEYVPQTDASWHRLILDADIEGTYIFTFNPVNKMLSITFPTKGYQLHINMSDGTKYTSNAVEETTDIMSFFAPGESDGGSVQLYYNGSLKSPIAASTFKTSGVYTAKLNTNKDDITDVALYEGNYYIRTDGAKGGWNDFKTNADNKMTYFVPREKEKYSYYWVAALPQADCNESNGVVNVKACVANEYNENLAVMLEADKFTDGYGNVTIKDPSDQKREKINVRFGYNPKTNHFERAMLTGSGNMPNFLNITDPEGKIFKDQNGNTALTEANTDSKFTDVSNWVYETNIWVHPANDGATVCLTATAYNDSINSLFGFEADGVTPKQETIIGKNSGEPREMRVVYDFKTNRMIMAWIPGDITITKEQSLQADVLFIRHENDGVPQLKITDGGKITDIQSQFFALELENDANKQGGNKEHAYWISLPFDCVVGSISGVPGYMETWGIQRYNGEKRAEIGWFKETYTFWEWLTQDDVMKAGEGYVLSFDKKAATWNTYDVHEKDENGNTISTTQKSLLRLYFPSTKTGYLFQENMNLTTKYDNQPCKITRDNRHLQDGNWKIIATTSYYNAQVKEGEIDNTEGAEYLSEFPKFRYTYWRNPNNRNDWKYTAEQGGTDAEYKSFHSYMVQYAGTITWKALNESIMPAGLAARRNSDSKATNITTRLVIADAEEVQHDQTFVALDEKGTTTFDQNLDLNKIFNSGKANIYTLSEGIPFAGNTLPMGEALVPVGVQIAAEGEYTFRMPDGTEGMMVELVDYETNTRTNLLLSDYIVTLPKGTNENRFALHIQPQKDVVTGVGNIDGGVNSGEGVKKYLIDGRLYLKKDGVLYDAQGKLVR